MGSPARLRVCGRCEWIFRVGNIGLPCPKCGFGHYSARYVYGNKAYRYAKTQKPWLDQKVTRYTLELMDEIWKSQQPIEPIEILTRPPEREEKFRKKAGPSYRGKGGKGVYETGTVGKLPY